MKISSLQDIYPFLENVDFVFNPFSYIPLEKAEKHPSGIISLACLIKKKPCLTFGGSWIGPLTIPGITPCYFCAIRLLERSTDLDPESRNQNIQKRAFAPPIAACCSMAVYEASQFLSQCDLPQTLNGIIQIDMFNFTNSQFLSLEDSIDCSYCKINRPMVSK